MMGASGAALGSKGEGEWQPGSSTPDAFHIGNKLILSRFLRNRAQTSFRLSPLP